VARHEGGISTLVTRPGFGERVLAY
jgi:hypothetical protein